MTPIALSIALQIAILALLAVSGYYAAWKVEKFGHSYRKTVRDQRRGP